MDLDTFLKDYVESYHDYIVRLAYRYTNADRFHISNEILCFDSTNGHIWLNDWDEGYTYDGEVFVLNFCDIDDVFIIDCTGGRQ